ncbi:LLM class flavin-dependent oxidoreductase [Rhodococcus sp. IEGM 1381]|uniref:LLM class flavin-dependent oxidoreductase n=1 Tax=Rhodococcus sp. IEGM 1381 TaxID=3047085 RepID=UPI0024B6976E|nr:LLM class flavin-dependent oxidoreductase [Rhodococcus sp. IEGM 1381]MDI9894533.1 LLM class flavin-dependent oxidoreductase [Rhodococcus sp. IEGM 1381]
MTLPMHRDDTFGVGSVDIGTTPIMNDQKMKLGLFAFNCSGGMVMSNAPTGFRVTWDQQKRIAQLADRIGFEAIVPVARWRGFGGDTNFNGVCYETFTWAAGLAEATENIQVFTTSHVPTIHPIAAAKMATTIDHISGGRYGINVVMGWFPPEMEMFGGKQLEHDDRYEYGGEWLDFVEELWAKDGQFDFDGKYFKANGVEAYPKPLCGPRPALINAGTSPAGLEFSAKYVDVNLTALDSLESMKEHSDKIKARARDAYARKIQVMTYALVVCRDTEEEAQADHKRIIDEGDWNGARNVMSALGMQSQSFASQIEKFQERFIAGWGGINIVGTPEQVADQFQELSEAGMDGTIMGFLDYEPELEHFNETVMPILRERGLRH